MVERSATGKQNVTITICARSARGKINDLTRSAGTSAPSQAAIARGREILESTLMRIRTKELSTGSPYITLKLLLSP
ncbi:hypothetical protein PUN28_001278 [Cardiocondyla obscurior]|uniref:Uncharacterized protein n=1 Tax=Cardiocondyla obscurior TaxID=286306 RepID=A0AAW2H473_9HYME